VTKGNNDRTAVVAEFLETVPADEIIIVTNYIAGRLFPAADPRVIGMAKEGAKVLVSSITGEPESKVIEALRSKSDLGVIIESLLNAKQMRFTEPTGLTVKQVSDMFASIASTDGSGSKASKIKAISDMLTNAYPIEAKYVVRLVTGEMPTMVGDMPA
jgi:DNA ligase-1